MTVNTPPKNSQESIVSQEEHWARLTRNGRDMSPKEQEADESFRRMAFESGTKIKWAEDFAKNPDLNDFQTRIKESSGSKER